MNQNVEAFMHVLDTSDNTTGGGTASSIAGAMAAGLAGMVARLSMGKEGLPAPEHFETIAGEAEELSTLLFDGGSEDARAFHSVSAAYKLPKETPENKAHRRSEIQKAMVHAAEVPLANGQRCRRVIELCNRLKEGYNTNAASDLECAERLAAAGLGGCAANVRINLPYIRDEDMVAAIGKRLKEMEANG